MDNYRSATCPEAFAQVEQQIEEEIAEGNYVVTPTKPTIVSALGAIPKPDSAEYRLIHDCSMPEGKGVNSYIDIESFKFQTIDDAVKLIDKGYYLAKIDLRHAYRSVPIHPSNYKATGLKWVFKGSKHPTYLIDKRLPYGGRSAPGIFHRITQAVRRMMRRRGFNGLVVYLDDFLIIAPTREECQLAFDTLMQLLRELGFQISMGKVVSPCQLLVFLGIQIDTNALVLSLPKEKLDGTKVIVQSFVSRKRASKRQLQTLAGKLNWACKVVYGGRTFLRRIIDQMNMLSSPGAKLLLNSEFRADILWWHQFLDVFNGKCRIFDKLPVVDVHTDACSHGVGAYFRGDWVYSYLPVDFPAVSGLHINYKELFSIYLAAVRWAPRWANQHVIIHSDNQPAVAMLNKGTTRNTLVMPYLRHLFWLSATYNFQITAKYIPGLENATADAVSRMHEPAKLFEFANFLCRTSFCASVNNVALLHHMAPNSALFLSLRYLCPGIGQ